MTSPSYNYGQNQFYGLNSFEPFTSTETYTSEDNPPFIWPPNSLRNAATGKTTKIQRGYLRLLSELFYGKAGDNLSTRRLHFQFNPDVITRSVAARNDIQLWFNMDPAQMTQPIPGDANFAFELLFNREAEVYSAMDMKQASRDARSGESQYPTPDSSSFVYNYSVADIGVLADLLVLDELIGQGVNQGLIEAMVERARAGSAYTLAQAAESTASEDTADAEDQSPAPAEFNEDDTRTALQNNWGNSAFLISQPIRVVFSSLFMVEGYVNSSTVVFNKFTPTMVPVQATVGIQMQAMYMGLGKKDTFFTYAFKKTEDDVNDYNDKVREENKALDALGTDLFKKVMTPGGEDKEDYVSVQEFFLNKGTDGNTNRDPLITKYLRVRASDALRTQLSTQKSIKEIMPSGSFTITYVQKGTGAPANTFEEGKTWEIPIQFKKPLNLKQLSTGTGGDFDNEGDNPDDRMTMEIPYDEDFFSFGLATPLDTTPSAKWRIEMKINFSLSTNAGGSATARQSIVYKSSEISFTDAVLFGDNATLSVDPLKGRQAIRTANPQ